MNYPEAFTENSVQIGDKVANCIALFRMYKIKAFPFDAWMKRILETLHNHNNFSLERRLAGYRRNCPAIYVFLWEEGKILTI